MKTNKIQIFRAIPNMFHEKDFNLSEYKCMINLKIAKVIDNFYVWKNSNNIGKTFLIS